MNGSGNIQGLIKNYIETLNPTVNIAIETMVIIGKNGDKDIKIPHRLIELSINDISFLWKQEELHNLNNKLNEETLIESDGVLEQIQLVKSDDKENDSFTNFEKLNYLNYLKIEEEKYLLFYLTFTGFEDDTKEMFLNTPHFSFFRYVLDCIFKKYADLGQNKFLEQNIDDSISSIGRDFINNLINHVCNEEGNENYNLYDELNVISTLNYEGQIINAKLLLIDEKIIEKHVSYIIKFEDVIAYKEHRKIRKLLEMTDESIYLIGDNQYIYGLGNLRGLYNLKESAMNKVLLIDFLGKFEYKLKEIKIIHNIKDGESKMDEIVHWFYEEKNLLSVKHGKMELLENTFSEIRLKKSLQNIFNKYLCEQENQDKVQIENKITNIVEVVKCAYNQKHGTTLVITTPEVAETEVERLKDQSIKINIIDTKESSYFRQVVEKITNIDGALYMDINGHVHAIGVILDGYAQAGKGDSSRGARYNSAIRYINGDEIEGKCVIVVISEDGMIDIIPDSEIEKQISKLAKRVNNLYGARKFEEALKLVKELEGLNPRRPETFFTKARILSKIDGELTNSLKAINHAIQLKEDFGQAYNLRSLIYLDLDKPEKAVYDLEKAIEINPTPERYFNLGDALVKLKNNEDAIDAYNNAIKLDKQFVRAYIGKVMIDYSEGEFKKALEGIKLTIDIKEDEPSLYLLQGRIYQSLNMSAEVIDSYRKAFIGFKDKSNKPIYKSKGFYKNFIFVCERLLESEPIEDEKNEYQEWIEKCNQKLID
ncbi:tetratricopeptide repeat protein [Bacillus cereus group sp. BfR-BA-01409]|uniref:tetratricopeptide repeat protein n=1 Tax=Bacillus cereus group sp. BfR-BA-01409 TaxID=2920338 RepID=UPI001F5A036B